MREFCHLYHLSVIVLQEMYFRGKFCSCCLASSFITWRYTLLQKEMHFLSEANKEKSKLQLDPANTTTPPGPQPQYILTAQNLHIKMCHKLMNLLRIKMNTFYWWPFYIHPIFIPTAVHNFCFIVPNQYRTWKWTEYFKSCYLLWCQLLCQLLAAVVYNLRSIGQNLLLAVHIIPWKAQKTSEDQSVERKGGKKVSLDPCRKQ